jgi:hypothetical protein
LILLVETPARPGELFAELGRLGDRIVRDDHLGLDPLITLRHLPDPACFSIGPQAGDRIDEINHDEFKRRHARRRGRPMRPDDRVND